MGTFFGLSRVEEVVVNPIVGLLKSRKFLVALLDLVVSCVIYFGGKYLGASVFEDVKFLIGATQVIAGILIAAIAYEDAALKTAGLHPMFPSGYEKYYVERMSREDDNHSCCSTEKFCGTESDVRRVVYEVMAELGKNLSAEKCSTSSSGCCGGK